MAIVEFDRWETMRRSWVSMKVDPVPNVFHACYRHNVKLSAPVSSGTLRIAACTLYKCYVNGQLIMLGPARSPAAYLYVDSIDVRECLRSGQNTLAVEVMYVGPHGEYAGAAPGFCLELEVVAGKKPFVWRSDATWRCRQWGAWSQEGAQFRYGGKGYPAEAVDLRRIDLSWVQPDYDDSGWDAIAEKGTVGEGAPLRDRPVPLPTLRTQVTRKIADYGVMHVPAGAESLTHADYLERGRFVSGGDAVRNAGSLLDAPPGSAILKGTSEGAPYLTLDFGGTVSGVYELDVEIPEGVRLDINYLEWLNDADGSPREKQHRVAYGLNPGCSLIGNGRVARFQSTHPYSCRWLTLVPRDLPTGQEVVVRRVAARELSSIPLATRADVVCSDPLLNRIVEAAKNTVRLNAPDFYMDCASHERAIYPAEARWSAPAGTIFYGNTAMVDAILNMALDERGHFEGWPNTVNSTVCMASATIGGLMLVNATWVFMVLILEHATYTGKPVPAALLDACARMVSDVDRYINDEGLLEAPPNATNWLDWSRVTMGTESHAQGIQV
ncbi:MAG: alpha-L-rhamnosidase N-terminal domain-containing protein, partial [Kiritimatiellae bacterium]|nr:alpha-L-rhamnosidase N-terminal domain-containing protein [Kiritimatiellia bacterium]